MLYFLRHLYYLRVTNLFLEVSHIKNFKKVSGDQPLFVLNVYIYYYMLHNNKLYNDILFSLLILNQKIVYFSSLINT